MNYNYVFACLFLSLDYKSHEYSFIHYSSSVARTKNLEVGLTYNRNNTNVSLSVEITASSLWNSKWSMTSSSLLSCSISLAPHTHVLLPWHKDIHKDRTQAHIPLCTDTDGDNLFNKPTLENPMSFSPERNTQQSNTWF